MLKKKKDVKNTKDLIKFMEFSFYFFLSSEIFFPTSQKIPCLDPSTVEYKAHALVALVLICFCFDFLLLQLIFATAEWSYMVSAWHKASFLA